MIAAPGAVASDMDDAAAAVRGLQAQRERPAGSRSKTTPSRSSQTMAAGAACGDATGDRRIAEPVAGRERVGGMQGGRSSAPMAAAMPPWAQAARRPAKRRPASRMTGPRRQPQRGHQAGDAAADDDGQPARSERMVCIATSLSGPPACARRRGGRAPATAGSIVTSCCIVSSACADLRQA